MDLRTAPVSRFRTVTVAEGTGAPDGSVTSPVMLADTWAVETDELRRISTVHRIKISAGRQKPTLNDDLLVQPMEILINFHIARHSDSRQYIFIFIGDYRQFNMIQEGKRRPDAESLMGYFLRSRS
jgi:hypothetical protein